jgi:hypothetical protein
MATTADVATRFSVGQNVEVKVDPDTEWTSATIFKILPRRLYQVQYHNGKGYGYARENEMRRPGEHAPAGV